MGRGIGRVEKAILIYLLERELKNGKTPVREADVVKSLADNYGRKYASIASASLPILWFSMMRGRETSVRRALKKLTLEKLIERVGVKLEGRRIYFCQLTEEGRVIALKFREKTLKEEKSDEELVQEALKTLWDGGAGTAAFSEIQEALRPLTGLDDEAFKKYWTKRRLGEALKKLGVRKIQKTVNGRKIIYILPF